MMTPLCDVFISYRRQGGAELAQLVYKDLKNRGYRVFMDVRELRSGHFDDELRRQVGGAKDFVLLLTPGSLDRCQEPGDWLLHEIALALQLRLNIVPIVKAPFQIPKADNLPVSIGELPRHNAVEYNHDKSDESLAVLVMRLCSRSNWWQANRKRLVGVCVAAGTLLAAIGAWSGFGRLERQAENIQGDTSAIKQTTSAIRDSTAIIQDDSHATRRESQQTRATVAEIDGKLDSLANTIREAVGVKNLGSEYASVSFHRDYQDRLAKESGKWSTLIEEYQQRVAASPSNAMYHYLLARAYENNKQPELARESALMGHKADATFMWNRRYLLYLSVPEKIDEDWLLREEVQHYALTPEDLRQFQSGAPEQVMTAWTRLKHRFKTAPVLFEDLDQRQFCWHLFRNLSRWAFNDGAPFRRLIGHEANSENGNFRARVLDVKTGMEAMRLIPLITEHVGVDEGQRVEFTKANMWGGSLKMPPVAVRLSITPLKPGFTASDTIERSFQLVAHANQPHPAVVKELLGGIAKVDPMRRQGLSNGEGDVKYLFDPDDFWVYLYSIPVAWRGDDEAFLIFEYSLKLGRLDKSVQDSLTISAPAVLPAR